MASISSKPYFTSYDLSNNQRKGNTVHEEPPPYGSSSDNTNISKNIRDQTQLEPRHNAASKQSFVNPQLTQIQSIDAIKTYTSWSIFNACCCCLCLGLIAYGYSKKVKKFKEQRNLQAASEASDEARAMNTVATGFGIVFIIVFIIGQFALGSNHPSSFP